MAIPYLQSKPQIKFPSFRPAGERVVERSMTGWVKEAKTFGRSIQCDTLTNRMAPPTAYIANIQINSPLYAAGEERVVERSKTGWVNKARKSRKYIFGRSADRSGRALHSYCTCLSHEAGIHSNPLRKTDY